MSINERDDERERQAETEASLSDDSDVDELDDDLDDDEDEEDDEQELEPAAAGAPASTQSWGRNKGPSRRTEARESRRHRFEARRARKRLFYGLGGGAIALALISGLFLPSVLGASTQNPGTTTNTTSASASGAAASVGTKFVAQDAEIVDLEEAHEPYSTSPPTSGARYAHSVVWGIYDQQIPDEGMVRNLEEGGVVIHHNLTDEAASADLQAFVESQPGYPGCFLMQPNASVAEGTVTLTAWEWLETYPGVDEVGMQAFIADHRNDAPLFVSNTCGAAPDTSTSG